MQPFFFIQKMITTFKTKNLLLQNAVSNKRRKAPKNTKANHDILNIRTSTHCLALFLSTASSDVEKIKHYDVYCLNYQKNK